MVQQEQIQRAIDVLAQAAHPVRIVLFGSQARGDPRPDSDLDFLVVERSVSDPHAEMVRLRRLLDFLRRPVDVVVVSADTFREWSDVPGNLLYDASREGIVLYDAA